MSKHILSRDHFFAKLYEVFGSRLYKKALDNIFCIDNKHYFMYNNTRFLSILSHVPIYDEYHFVNSIEGISSDSKRFIIKNFGIITKNHYGNLVIYPNDFFDLKF